jgi:hypothetical protein
MRSTLRHPPLRLFAKLTFSKTIGSQSIEPEFFFAEKNTFNP